MRSFLSELRKRDLLITVKREVDRRFELAAVLKNIAREGKAAFFEKVKGSPFPVVSNILGSRQMLAQALGCEPEATASEFSRRSKLGLATRLVKDAPVKEVILKGKEASLEEFPIVVHCEKDAGPYLTAGIAITKDPDTGTRNVSMNRIFYGGGNQLKIRMMPPQHLGVIQAKAEEKGQDLELAVAIGNHPLELVAAATTVSYGYDEFVLASSLKGEPVELVKCETLDLEVPATAEIVLEGKVLAGVREPEGPFGDFMQYYIPALDNHVFKILAITHRREPIYQTIQAGTLEDAHLLGISREARVWEAVAATGAEVRAVSLVPMILSAAISIRKRFEGEGKNVAAAAFGSYSWLKYCIVVDHDVDPFDINDVWWAIATRSNPNRGHFLMADSLGFPRDPFNLHSAKMAIDATAPLNQWQEFERKRIPGETEIHLKDYV